MSRSFISVDPSTGKRLRSYPAHSGAAIDAALRRARAAALGWRAVPLAERARLLRAAAAVLRHRWEGCADLITAEMGKPLAQSRAEIEKCARLCDYCARFGPRFLADEIPAGAPPLSRILFQPLGTVLAIMPWNFPFWQAFRAIAPALCAGNAVLLKHSSNVSGCALAIEDVFRAAGFPSGLCRTLLVGSERVPALIADPRVQAVTLTGSAAAGRRVGALAGAALKKGVFELGGSDPYLVLADADLDQAAEICAASRLINSGQSCVAAKRFVVVAPVRRAFERKFAERLAARPIGDPRDPATEIGPLAREDLRDELQAQVAASLKRGARLLLGGEPWPGPGFFHSVTLLTDVRPGQPAADEELFGPVAAILPVANEEAAIAAANASRFGLGAAVFTRNRRRGRAVAARLAAGVVAVNDFVRSDPALPFGGVKESGYGRELGAFGLREFVNVKTVCG